MMLVKEHRNNSSLIISICDSDLIGKKFEENKLELDLTTGFYDGERMIENKILKLISECTCMMLIGKKSVSFAIEKGLANKENIKEIHNIPHLQILLN